MSIARCSSASAIVSDKILVIGGSDLDGNDLDFVELYDPARNKWFPAAPMLEPRYECEAGSLNNFVYVFGGSTNNIVNQVAVDRYSIKSDTWTRVR